MGMLYGAKDYEKLHRQISSSMIGGLLFSVIITILAIILAPVLLTIMQADESVMKIAIGYLRIVLMGLAFTFIYNFYASVLRVLGDSRTPLYFLAISSVLNVIGDFSYLCGWLAMLLAEVPLLIKQWKKF